MDYAALRRISDVATRQRTVAGLQRLRTALAAQLPARSLAGSLLLGTWNIREFDSGRYGWRSDECLFYIAEILSRFDLVAVQEVRENLYALQRVCRLLGPGWDYLITDVTLGRSGNSERLAFVYDSRKVHFTGLAAELVLPGRDADNPVRQLARSPYIAGFRCGWAYLTLVTVHIYYGEDRALDPRRLDEIRQLAGTLSTQAAKFSAAPRQGPEDAPRRDNLLLLGDFNIFARTDDTLRAIESAGFSVPAPLQTVPGSNVARDRHYDQIAHHRSLQAMRPTGRAGVFDYYEQVYRDADEALYGGERSQRPGRSFRDWRSYRMSDHLPMWIEFDVDDADGYLRTLAEG